MKKITTEPEPMDAGRVLAVTDQWRNDAKELDQDRAELSRHFNGGALNGDDDFRAGAAHDRRPNILTGYKFLDRPIGQMLDMYDAGAGFLEIKVRDPQAQPARRLEVEQIANRVVNQAIQESERMFWPFRSMVGDAVIQGVGTLYRDDPYDWAPKFGQPYYNWNAPSDITSDKFADWAFLDEITCEDIIGRLKRLEKVSEEDSYWDKEKLRAIVDKLCKRARGDAQDDSQSATFEDPLKYLEWIQTQSWGATALASSVPVVWFFSKRFEEDGTRPIDLYCVPRWGETVDKSGKISRSGETPYLGTLFYQPRVFAEVRECFFPFVISCMIGGKPLMRRTMGLGSLMYDLDVRVQESINNMFDASDFDFSPLFQATDSQSEAELQALGGTRIRPYDIMPSGARFMEKPKGNRPYTSVFELTQLMSTEMGNQAQQFHGGESFQNKGRAELEVQVLERRQQLTTALRQRMGDFVRRGDPLCRAIGNLLINEPDLLYCDRAYGLRQDIIASLKDEGVEWAEVAGKCTFQMRRSPGHGDPGLALSRAQQTEMIARQIGPEAHRIAQRNLIAAINGGDTAFASQLVPMVPPNQGTQEQGAMEQSAACLVTFMPQPILPTDNPMAHVPIHMAILQSHFTLAVQMGNKWTPGERRGWEALAAHTIADTRQLAQINPQVAKQVEAQIKQMAGKASSFQMAGIGDQPDPIEQAKLQLAAREQDRRELKTQDDIRHRNETQDHREEVASFQQNMQMAQMHNMEQDSAVKRATMIAGTARDLAEPIQQPEPPGESE